MTTKLVPEFSAASKLVVALQLLLSGYQVAYAGTIMLVVTSFMDTLPRNTAATVRNLPILGSQAARTGGHRPRPCAIAQLARRMRPRPPLVKGEFRGTCACDSWLPSSLWGVNRGLSCP